LEVEEMQNLTRNPKILAGFAVATLVAIVVVFLMAHSGGGSGGGGGGGH